MQRMYDGLHFVLKVCIFIATSFHTSSQVRREIVNEAVGRADGCAWQHTIHTHAHTPTSTSTINSSGIVVCEYLVTPRVNQNRVTGPTGAPDPDEKMRTQTTEDGRWLWDPHTPFINDRLVQGSERASTMCCLSIWCEGFWRNCETFSAVLYWSTQTERILMWRCLQKNPVLECSGCLSWSLFPIHIPPPHCIF